MWCTGQTLRHKETNELVSLVPAKEASVWHWGNSDKGTLFYREDGTMFTDDHQNYTHVEDELGRPVSHPPKEGEFVDTSLKKYLVSPEKLAKMREDKLKSWEQDVLVRLYRDNRVFCPFADGSRSKVFKDYFLDKYGAIPLHITYNSISKKFDDMYCRQYIFWLDGTLWMYDDQMSEIKEVDLGHMKAVTDFIKTGDTKTSKIVPTKK